MLSSLEALLYIGDLLQVRCKYFIRRLKVNSNARNIVKLHLRTPGLRYTLTGYLAFAFQTTLICSAIDSTWCFQHTEIILD